MTRVYISIGSNVDRESNVNSGVDALREHYGDLTISSIYESPAVGFDGDNFYNLVVGFQTDDPVWDVLDTMHQIEDEHGRERNGESMGPRTLDLDLLLYGELVINDVNASGLVLPRDEITRYAFVLCPLAEIAAGERHPVAGQCYGELWQSLLTTEDQALWPADLVLKH